MKEMRRLLSFLLVLAMVVGFVPATAFAATVEANFTGSSNTATDYLFFGTDRHADTDIIGKLLTNMESDIGDGALDYVGLGGDMVDSTNSYNSSTVLAEVTAVADHMSAKNVDILYASHDKGCTDGAGILNKTSGLWMTLDNCYVYGVIEDDVKSASSAQSAAAAFVTWAEGLTDDKAIMVLSHFPLHANRGDNAGAGYWHNALNQVATGSEAGGEVVRDVAFFHGHNHTVDTTEYFYAVGESMSIESYVTPSATMAASVEPETFTMQVLDPELELLEGMTTNASANGTKATIYYTYATAGYLTENRGNGQAMLVAVDADSITFTKYKSSSESVLGTVDRKVTASAVPTNLIVTGTDTYTVGETFVAPTVSVKYSDGTNEYTETLEAGQYEVSGEVNTAVAGEYTLTYECTLNGYAATAKFTVTVKEAETQPTEAPTTEPTEAEKTVSYILAEGTTAYTVGDELTFKVYVEYTDGTSEYVTQDDCQLTMSCTAHTACADVATAMATVACEMGDHHQVTVTYGGKDTTYDFTVGAAEALTGEAEGVTVYVSSGVVASVTAVSSANTYVADAMAAQGAENYAAYDIAPEIAMKDGNYATISLPVGSDWDTDSLAAYYVSDDGTTVEKIEGTYADGFYSFRVSHFSTYVVTAPATEGGEGTVPGDSTTTTKEVWILTAEPTNNGTYLIVNINADGSGYALLNNNGSVSTVAVTVVDDGTNDPYIILDNANAVWTAANDESGWQFTNGEYFVGVTSTITNTSEGDSSNDGYTDYSYALSITTAENYWTLGENTLSVIKTTRDYSEETDETDEFFLSGGSTWSLSTNSANVYFYTPETITITEGTQTATYGINITVNGEDASTMNANNVVNGDTLTLGTAFTTTVAGQNPPSTGTYTWTSSDTTVATVDNTGKVTFTGKEGETKISVSYKWDTYELTNTLVITTTAMSYSMNIVEETADVRLNGTKTLNLVTKNGDGNAVTAENVTWTSSATDVATVENGVVTGVSLGTATITAEWTDPAGVKHTDSVVVTVKEGEPEYVLEILDDNGTVIDWVTSLEKVTSSTTLPLGVLLTADGATVTPTDVVFVSYETRTGGSFTPVKGVLYWTVNDDSIVTTIDDDGTVHFADEKTGLVNVSVYYCDPDSSNWLYDTITITVTDQDYYTPEDSPTDFPEYPNEGSININKTATAVGNFSQTGIAQVELYGNGVPLKAGEPIDVVLMLDITGSMDDHEDRIPASKASAIAFLEAIVLNKDDSYNNNRIGIYYFNKNGAGTVYDFGTIDNKTELDAAKAAINSFDSNQASGGTPYDKGLSKCQEVLAAAKTDGTGNNRKQFCVFMTDGVPTSYAYVNGSTYGTLSSASSIAGMLTSASDYAIRDTDYKYEYYSTEMKKAGVTVYTVGLGLENKNSAWSGGSATQCLNLASRLLNDIAGPANEASQPDAVGTSTLSKMHTGTDFSVEGIAGKYFFSVDDEDSAANMSKIFASIGETINKAAATDVTVYDQITDDYELIFELPDAITDRMESDSSYSDPTGGQEFYVEVVNYHLDDNYNRVYDSNGNPDVDTLIRIYIDNGGAYYYNDSNVKTYYTAYDAETNPTGVTVTFGTDGEVGSIVCQYFTYNAATKSFTWTTDELGDEHQIALRYFVYLSDSLENLWDGNDDTEIPAKPYDTNTIAWIEYKNHLEHLCRQEFPVPQLTWNGAQVTYVFYLVNENGLPINTAGTEIPFSNSIEVTDRHTISVVWNDEGNFGESELFVEMLAAELLPEYYVLYDPEAHYTIHVYEDETGTDIGNHFIIANGKPINGDDDGITTDTDYTTKVYMDKSGVKYDADGTYTAANVFTGFDFADTTVAFAVMFAPALQEDVVVVDFGLDVVIDVTANDKVDTVANDITLNGVSATKTAYGNVKQNTGFRYGYNNFTGFVAATSENPAVAAHCQVWKDGTAIRVKQTSMEFSEPVIFYYDAAVKMAEGNTGYMYSQVTVIPATTVYYEDSFVTFDGSNGSGVLTEIPTTLTSGQWYMDGTAEDATQADDRPGLEGSNVYGYDGSYAELSEHSMGSAAMIHVDENSYGTASFSFYGTGFDVISMTSNMTGTLIVSVKDSSGATVRNHIVDTYYGYKLDPDNYDMITYTYWGVDEDGNEKWSAETEVVAKNNQKSEDKPTGDLAIGESTYTVYKQRWITTNNDPNAVYQVPVMKISGLTYGQHTVTITATYNSYFDHTDATGYDLYLDAIRIYDPTGNLNDTANDAYVADGEGWPVYKELRDLIISANDFDASTEGEQTSGAIFIDHVAGTYSVADYTSYGPNNEVYLAAGQAIAFNLSVPAGAADVQIGMKLANGANAAYEIYNVVSGGAKLNTVTGAVKTATDMYYSIKTLADNGTIVITNTGDGILSLTNIKITYSAEPAATALEEEIHINGESATNAVKSLSYVQPSTATFDPETMDITFNRTTASVGNNVIVTVTTSSDVKDLIVNGRVATNKTTSYLTGETTWSFTVPVENNGSLKVTVVGYDVNGEYTVPYTESVTVVNMSGNAEDLLGKLFG